MIINAILAFLIVLSISYFHLDILLYRMMIIQSKLVFQMRTSLTGQFTVSFYRLIKNIC